MKKHFITLGLMFAATLALSVSCVKESNSAPAEEAGIPFVISAGVDTKTTTADGSTISWASGDKLSVFNRENGTTGDYSSNNQFTFDEGNNFTGTLAAELTADAYDWWAFYPYNKNIPSPENSTYYTTIGGGTQNGNSDKAHLAGSKFPLYGKVSNVAKDAKPTITLKQVMAVIKVHVTNTSNDPLVVNNVSVTAPVPISGQFFINFAGENPVFANSTSTSNTATLAVTNGAEIAKNGTADFYVPVKPFSLTNQNLTISVNGSETVLENITYEFAPGVIKLANASYAYVAPTIHTVAEAVAEVGALEESATIPNYYVKGIISKIVTAYNSTFHNVSFNISDDGLTTSDQFQAYRASATSATDFEVGDAVIMYGTAKKYNSTLELDAGCTSHAILKAPVIAPNGQDFAESVSVTITATAGATIYYTTDDTTPTTASTVYSTPLNITATTTVKAIAVKDELTTGVVSATFTKSEGGESTSTLTFAAKCNGSGTADDGAVWTVTSDGAESTFDSTSGIHYGTGSAEVTYVQLATSDISGTITRVVVNARDAQNCATVSVTVGDTDFTCSGSTTATNTSTDFTFTGSASGNIVVKVDRGESKKKAIYVKSVVVTYSD